LIGQQGYEIDSQGNIGNETTRIEDLLLRFVLLMAIIPLTIKDGSASQIAKQAVKACHKESGIPMSELASLIKRMTKEVKEITDMIEKILKKCGIFLEKIEALVSHRHSFFSPAFLFFILGPLYFRYLGCNCIESPEFWSPKV